jgi:Ca2+-binding RTX toxin-like protein
MSGDTGDIDRFVAGYKPSTHTVRVEGTRQNSGGTSMSVITCQSSNWKKFTSLLRDRADRVRANAVGMTASGFVQLPATMNTVLNGGNGNDRLVGHDGPDNMNGAGGEDILNALAGNDVLRTADGVHDDANCGPGTDKATVDLQDDRAGCEDVTVVVRPAP